MLVLLTALSKQDKLLLDSIAAGFVSFASFVVKFFTARDAESYHHCRIFFTTKDPKYAKEESLGDTEVHSLRPLR